MFRPGATFAYLRWSSNDFGTIHSSIQIVTAVAVGEPHTALPFVRPGGDILLHLERSEEHTSELQSLMRTSSAVFCLKKKTTKSISHVITQLRLHNRNR